MFSRSARKAEALRGIGLVASAPDRHASALTRTQELFIDWNAERLGISREESAHRYAASRQAVPGGHTGKEFAKFHGYAHEVMRVFFDDNANEVFDTYRYHGPLHFLAHLTYPEPSWAEGDLIVRELKQRANVSILDFGCGLAQQSRTLAEYLRDTGLNVRLTLADVPTLREDFLLWWGRRVGIPTRFLRCTREEPIPELPDCDYCQATEFFEHVHDPVRYFERFDAKLSPGGLLVTGVMDHYDDFMHVSPDLKSLRERIAAKGYETIVPNQVLRKPRA